MVTQAEIAKRANVNISTVSRALNNEAGISDVTRKSILKIASELGYNKISTNAPNDVIGVIIPELVSQYYASLAHTLEQRIRAKGHSMILTLSGFVAENIIQELDVMVRHNARGIICSLPMVYDEKSYATIIQAAKNIHAPLVFLTDIDNEEHIIADHICLDERAGIEQAVNHLLSLGHKNIGFVGEVLSTSRYNIYKRILDSKGIEINQKHVCIGNTRFEKGGYEQMNQLLSAPTLPTAVFISYDQFAIGALKAIEEAGLRVPDDISIVSFDNIVTDDYLSVKLTSVTNPVVSMGRIATRLLFNKIFHPEEIVIQKVLLQPTLLVRESTGRAK